MGTVLWVFCIDCLALLICCFRLRVERTRDHTLQSPLVYPIRKQSVLCVQNQDSHDQPQEHHHCRSTLTLYSLQEMVWGTSIVVQGLKNPPSNAGDTGSILRQGTKTPHAKGQLRAHAISTELSRCKEKSCVLQLRPVRAK